jgi:hypothetical protein
MTTAHIEQTVDADALKKLRDPFKAEQIDKLPKILSRDDKDRGKCIPGSKYTADGTACGGYHARAVHLDYVGHAQTTARLLDVDPEWTWEPVAWGEDGLPKIDSNGGLWIRLTVAGMTRLGYGDAQGKTGPNAVKEAIGDALRNAAMRFGLALDLWSKSDIGAAADTQTAREWVVEAQAADTVDGIREIWKQARAAGADVDTLDKITVLATERLEGGV